MKLLFAAASPFARKVRATIIETGLEDRVELVPVIARQDAPDPVLIAQNPLGKLPCLVPDDDAGNTHGALFDSRVITRYLDAQADGGLYPADDWQVLTLEALGDGIMDCALVMVYERRFRDPEMVSEDIIGWQWAKIARALDELEHSWASTLSNDPDAGHISLACALGYLDFRLADRNWREGRPGLSQWEAGFAALPSISRTIPTD